MRLDQKWEAQQRQHGSEIGKREKMVGRAAGSAARVPGLQQRTGGAQQYERQADRKREESQDAPGRVDLRVGAPEKLRSDGQPQKADKKKPQVSGALAFWREVASS